MNIADTRDFKIGGRTYRDTLIARDVHQISNPATGHVYGEVVQIPADGRAKAYYLAGPGRERAETWEAAVQAARAQQPDPMIAPAPAPAAPVVAPPAPEPKSVAPAIADTAPDGWLPAPAAAKAYGLPSYQHVYNEHHAGRITGMRVRCPRTKNGRTWQWVFAPPRVVAPVADTPAMEWLPIADAAPLYGIHVRTLRRYAAEGKVSSKVEGNKYYVVPPATPVPQRVAAADMPSAPEPTVLVRPAGTKIRELEARIAALEARTARPSWWDRLTGRGAT